MRWEKPRNPCQDRHQGKSCNVAFDWARKAISAFQPLTHIVWFLCHQLPRTLLGLDMKQRRFQMVGLHSGAAMMPDARAYISVG